MSIDYDGVVSICDAHGIALPVDCMEMVVEIVRHATAHSGDGGEEFTPNTMAGFVGGFRALNKRNPTHQELWDAAVKSAINRYSAPVPQVAADDRARFEAHMLKRGQTYLYRRDSKGSARLGQYCRQSVQDEWETWQSALVSRPCDRGENLKPVEPSALSSSIAEVEALSLAEDRDLTVSEMESMMLVLLELRRLQAVAVPQDGDERAVWAPEVLSGPSNNVCWTQDMVPRAERINAVVISQADYDRACAALTSNKVAAVAVGEPIQGSPAYALRGLYKVADYYVDGAPVSPEEYIAWQSGIIEAITKAKVPDPKHYGGSAEEGDQHEVKCAYVDGWNDCRGSILNKSPAPIASASDARAILSHLVDAVESHMAGDAAPVRRYLDEAKRVLAVLPGTAEISDSRVEQFWDAYNEATQFKSMVEATKVALASIVTPPASIASAEEAMPVASDVLSEAHLMEAVELTIDTLDRQLDLIAERAPGKFLDKTPVVRSLTAHKERLERAVAERNASFATHPAAAQPSRVEVLLKLRAAQMCHPNAVQPLIEEAIDLLEEKP